MNTNEHFLLTHESITQDITASDVTTVVRPRLPTETTVTSTASMDIESASLPAKSMDAGKKDSGKSECTDECSSDDVVNDDDPMDEFMADSEATITIPLAGDEYHEDHGNGEVYREVPNGCAICLCAFDESDSITWSSNASCNHVFHRDCIVDWFVASGRKALQRQRRQEARTGVGVQLSDDALKRITSCPMLCPCCRQEFATPPPDNIDDPTDLLEKRNNSTITDTLSGNSFDDSSPAEDSPAAVVVTGDDAV
jgi:hypothetical protein